MGKTHPQSRAGSAVERMIRSRSRHTAQAQAQEWLDAGWNPLARQDGEGPRAWSAAELMLQDSAWFSWLFDRKDEMKELAKKAFVEGADGKLRGGARMLANACDRPWTSGVEMLLGWGLDPNEIGYSGMPPIFQASRECAERLLAFGADPSARDARGEGLWEEWARRCAMGKVSAEDFEWLESICPAPKELSAPAKEGDSVGAMALRYHSAAMAQRLSELWPRPETFEIDSDKRLGELITAQARMGDHDKIVKALAVACGADRVARAVLLEGPTTEGKARDWRLWPAAEMAMVMGRLKMLGELERCGLLKERKPSSVALGAAALARAKPDAWASESCASGVAWAVVRMEKEEEPKAVAALKLMAEACGSKAMRVAERLATRGWLPSSGEGSLADLFGPDGRGWSERELKSPVSFAEFSAMCEKKAVRAAAPVKKAKGEKKSKGPARL